MFYWLVDAAGTFPVLNVFRYITFRTGGAMVTAALFVFLFGPWIIDHLRLRQGKGQPIRTDGPQSHLISKKGTPTMGGLMILSGLVVSTLLWANPLNPYVWIVLAVTLGFGFVGFYDDYLKVTKQSHSGFAGRLRLLIEAVIAIAACVDLHGRHRFARARRHAGCDGSCRETRDRAGRDRRLVRAGSRLRDRAGGFVQADGQARVPDGAAAPSFRAEGLDRAADRDPVLDHLGDAGAGRPFHAKTAVIALHNFNCHSGACEARTRNL